MQNCKEGTWKIGVLQIGVHLSTLVEYNEIVLEHERDD